jgi:hypothetical protein
VERGRRRRREVRSAFHLIWRCGHFGGRPIICCGRGTPGLSSVDHWGLKGDTASKEKIDKLQDDSTSTPGPPGWKFPDECVYAKGPAATPVYAGSGNTAVSGDMDTTSLGNDQDVMVGQAVMLFPSAKEANDFFTTSAQRWPACADRQITEPVSPQTTYKIGPFSDANGILSVTQATTMSMTGQPGVMTVSVQRALTARNNVVVDVVLMRKDPADLGVKVAAQIAGKIDKQQ